MAKVSFYLSKPNDESSTIMMNVSLNGFRVQASTGKSILTNLWDKKKNKCKSNKFETHVINSHISHLESKVLEFCSQAQLDKRKLSKTEVYDYLKILKNPNLSDESPDDILTAYSNYIEIAKDSYSVRTLKHYNNSLSKLRDFQKKTGKIMTFTNLDEHLWLSFEKHLYDKGLCTNTVRQINRNIKTALNYYANKGYIQHSQFRNYIKTDTSHDGQEEKYQILTTEDIQKLKNYQPKNQREIVYKDIFLIQTALGLRISDMLALNSHNVNMDEQFIALTTQKTKSSIKIPFSDYIKSLFEKYPSRMPIINESSYNYFIKIICKKAGITEEVSYFVKKGKSKVEIVVPKYKLISSHTARRTMITNALQKGMLPEELMKITGHKSRQSFDKYVQPNREQAIEKFRNLVME